MLFLNVNDSIIRFYLKGSWLKIFYEYILGKVVFFKLKMEKMGILVCLREVVVLN